ncbi:MAG: ribose-phosphate diphosphokinase [Candidatus Competibacteraceae bacterium]|nr:ribose-phosphate diphosphokinase [Candidatus Competibacteraceae bacterium]
MMQPYSVFALSHSKQIAESVCHLLRKRQGQLFSTRFSDGEVYARFDESIRGETIVLMAQVDLPYTNLFELFITIDAARRASAKEIICVIPYLPHSRQERKDDARSSVSARLIADFIEHSGADRIITIDMHSTSIEGFYKIPIDHISMNNEFIRHIRTSLQPDNLCLCSPDFGGLKRIKQYKSVLNCEMSVIHKERLHPNQVSNMEIIGDVKGKDVVIIDDMIDTGGTLCKAADMLLQQGAQSVHAYCTHGVLSDDAISRIENSGIHKLIISDSIPRQYLGQNMEQISCAPMLASAIDHLMRNKSVKQFNQTHS